MSVITKQDWISQIEKELKTKTWKEQGLDLGSGIVLPPAYHKEDVNGREWHPVQTIRDFKPLVGFNFSVKSSKETNIHLHSMLKFGLESPGLAVEAAWDGKTDELFEGIHTDWLSWVLDAEDEKLAGVKTGLVKEGVPVEWRKLSLSNASESLGDTMNRWNQELLLWAENPNDEFCFSTVVGTEYLSEIAKLRALRRLFANACRALNIAEKPFFLNVQSQLESELDKNSRLISNSIQLMAAFVGGADRIAILPSSYPEQSDSRDRMVLTLQHIAHMEAHLDKRIDPLCGSWWIENATDAIAKHFWGKLKLL